MPIREWQLRILDMLGCIDKVQSYTAGMDRRFFAKDDKTIDAVMRNLVAHVYFGVDLKVVWHIVTVDLAELETQLEKLRASEGF